MRAPNRRDGLARLLTRMGGELASEHYTKV
jgi:hypothetical protein